MPEKRVTVASKVGLHARPAALVAKAAAAQPVAVTIAKAGGDAVAAGSVLNLMTLAAAFGDEVVISAEGEGADAAIEAVAELVATDLDGN
ncbi:MULTISPECIES: HPr family phosphocarrier protein [unclassified Amycolatopsis]|uniref:HPr family phosphocarrier protein n=1 Tax=unclassified Amycolatopsis TaxID=2618356 RepID=UPI001C697526|nr:HPr family phosphocarrier protein [Amycolatopsis sp. DSM 110486]QYN17394.1 HPr family phosphocarrier protein [Amycolatopsis sp. DSM 110486]